MASEAFESVATQTKIVATVGPASRSPEQLTALARAGVDVFRLNMAHASREEHQRLLADIRQVSAALGKPLAALVDLAGPKIRLGDVPGEPLDCHPGEELHFVRDVARQPGELTSSYPEMIDELRVGDRVMVADGTIRLEVARTEQDAVVCRVQQGGTIRSRQGVNLPGAKISLPALTDADRENARWAAEQGVDFVSLSFVRAADDVRELKWLLKHHQSPAHVIAKIEKQEALDDLEQIITQADGVMVARGDLGVEIDVARMPVVQKQIVRMCNAHSKPVIIATQMLDSMQRSRQPTRAEVTDVANAILDGCDACMLSGETAVGEFPVDAVRMMRRIAAATEPLLHERETTPRVELADPRLSPVTQGAAAGADRIARELKARLLVVVSHSGASALALSKRRNPCPIIGVSDDPATLGRMCLAWGLVPMAGAPTSDSSALLKHVEQWGLAQGIVEPGSYIVLLSGTNLVSLGHNMVRVYEVGRRARPDGL